MGKLYEKLRDLSINRKLFAMMAAVSVLPVLLVTVTALSITYSTMRDQLIYDSRMSVEWLQSRLEMEIEGYTRAFYKFEIEKSFCADVYNWYDRGDQLDCTARLRMIGALNQTVSIDKNINSVELYNLSTGEALIAKRSGAAFTQTDQRLDGWAGRGQKLQTNIVFLRDEKEIQLYHQMYRADSAAPVALMLIRLRPYFIQDILDDIKTVNAETLLLFNDQGDIIESDLGSEEHYDLALAGEIAGELSGSLSGDMHRDGYFWFYRSVSGGKLIILQSIPDSTILRALSTTLLSGVAVAVLAVIISLVFSAAFARIVSKPVVDLSEKMRSISLDRENVMETPRRGDEIGFLQDSFNEMVTHNRELIDSEYKSKIAKRNAQLYALQSQINPHFMYNTLQVIGGMALKSGVPDIYSVTTALGDILRYSLSFSREMVELREEIRYLECYISIQNHRFGNKIKLRIESRPRLLSAMIPKLILQPLLENSFSHGLPEKTGPWDILLRARLTESGDLLLQLSDNGVGIAPETLSELRARLAEDEETGLVSGKHIGLSNVNMRLRLRYGGAPYGITIASGVGEGTTVAATLKYLDGEAGKDEIQGDSD